MRRAVGLSVAAVVLSITLGVLIGLVIHTGMSQRAGETASAASSPLDGTSSQSSTASMPGSADPTSPVRSADVGPAGAGGVDPWPASVTPVPDDTSSSAASTSGTVTVTTRTTVTPGEVTTSSAPPSRTTTTPPTTHRSRDQPAGSTPPDTTAARSSASPPAPARSTVTPGADAPERRCRTLGAKSATAEGATLFCQHDQTDGSLRWRAVTNRGGCLNQQMTGTGLDGRAYQCHRDPDGLNRWKRAG